VDAVGAVIPGAECRGKDTGTGIVTIAVSNGRGIVLVAELPIGTTPVTCRVQGFKTVVNPETSCSRRPARPA
jgi:hypothetical protein